MSEYILIPLLLICLIIMIVRWQSKDHLKYLKPSKSKYLDLLHPDGKNKGIIDTKFLNEEDKAEAQHENSMYLLDEISRISQLTFDKNKNLLVNFIKPYLKPLSIKYDQLFYKDHYGDMVFDDWWKELDSFVDKKTYLIRSKISQLAIVKFDELYDFGDSSLNSKLIYHEGIEERIKTKARALIEEAVDDYLDELEPSPIYKDKNLSDPILFEKAVEQNFIQMGWQAKQTIQTRDQGADVIAIKNDYSIIVQCKLYSQPVGNKAVQEVFSAMNFYKGNKAMVVTNSSYTKSAKQLANSCNVILLNCNALTEFLQNFEMK